MEGLGVIAYQRRSRDSGIDLDECERRSPGFRVSQLRLCLLEQPIQLGDRDQRFESGS